MKDERTLRALGLCEKAGKLICGTQQVCEALRSKQKPYAVVMASGNSDNTVKRLTDKCAYYGVELLYIEANGEMLSDALGKSGRIAAAAITDSNLCQLVRGTLNKEHL